MTFFQIERKAVETGEIETMRGENGHITIAPLFRKTACEFEKALILEDIFVDKLWKLPGFDGKSLKLASATHEIVESGWSKEIFIVVKLAINGEPTEVTVCIDIDDFIQALNELRHKNPETDLDEVT